MIKNSELREEIKANMLNVLRHRTTSRVVMSWENEMYCYEEDE